MGFSWAFLEIETSVSHGAAAIPIRHILNTGFLERKCLIGACGGFYVVLLNALLQDRGHETVGAGYAIGVGAKLVCPTRLSSIFRFQLN